ncbi:MAG: ImmA/IrrE family metallo-endopeptidase [Bryobacterales bacterium]|nr:ImmA/IrrE family metallo-endopeptidase [Bryobacterales bacterium]
MPRRWIRIQKIQSTVRELLKRFDVQAPPIPIHRLARGCNACIVQVAGREDDIDGFLYREGGEAVIGVNQDQAAVRQRFTIAHELGHLLLHEHSLVHVDRGFRVRLRNGASREGTDKDEMEANRFAAELLMPTVFLRTDLEEWELDLADDRQLRALAKRYGVSTQALAIRLNTLGYSIETVGG